MNLKILINKDYYSSDSIENGRLIRKFFENLSKNVFYQSYKYWKRSNEILGNNELPILFRERNLYSMFAVAIDKITPVHVSEWSFNPSDHEKIDSSRRVDFWCLNKEGENGRPVNYFIEIKKGWCSLNERSSNGLQKVVSDDIKSLVDQTKTLKSISPNWGGVDDVFLGISIIHGYYRDGEEFYGYEDIINDIYGQIDKRSKVQLIFSTWILPEDMMVQWEKDKCRFVSIAGIVVSGKA